MVTSEMRLRFPVEAVSWWGVSCSGWAVVGLGSGCWRRRRCVDGSVLGDWGRVVSVSEVVGEGHSSVLEPSDSLCESIAAGTVALADACFLFFATIGMGSPAHMRCRVNAASRRRFHFLSRGFVSSSSGSVRLWPGFLPKSTGMCTATCGCRALFLCSHTPCW